MYFVKTTNLPAVTEAGVAVVDVMLAVGVQPAEVTLTMLVVAVIAGIPWIT